MKLPWPGPLLPGASQPVWIRTASEGDLGSLAQYFEGLSRSARPSKAKSPIHIGLNIRRQSATSILVTTYGGA